MTTRAVILGFLGAAFICGVSYFNDFILQQTYLVGNNMPVSVYGVLIIFCLVVNPLLGKRAFKGKELALVVAMTLAACCIPGSGLMRTFTTSLILPHHFVKTTPGWKANNILDEIPPNMLADVSKDEDTALIGFVQGLGGPDKPFTLADVPWSAWKQPLLFWLPLLLTAWIALIAIAPMLHRQWAHHEHLPYPVAEFTNALLPDRSGKLPAILKNRLFWIATICIFTIHFNNFLCTWFPESLIYFNKHINLIPLARLSTTFQRGGGAGLLAPTLYFSVIGLAYFLASDVVLSCGIGPFFWCYVCGCFATYGISLRANIDGVWYLGISPLSMLNFGSYLGMAILVLYLGRRYYLSTLKQALFIKSGDIVEKHVVNGMRIFLVLVPLLFIQLVRAGLEWPFAIIYIAGLFMFFIMISRVMAETGIFYIQPFFMPSGIVWALFGASAIGTRQLMILLMLCLTFVIDPRETLLPFISGSLKVNDDQSLKLGKATTTCALAMILGLAVAIPTTLFLQYKYGVPWVDSWSAQVVPKMPCDNVNVVAQRLIQQDQLEKAANYTTWERFINARPEPKAMIASAAGIALVIAFAFARLRITWWPLHPVLFLVWSTEPQRRMAGAFLVGWLLKTLVSKYGGAKFYQLLKPMAFGLVAGEILGSIIPCLICAIYYAITKEIPPRFMVLPG